jgi:subtilisin family serine protease
MVLVGDSRGADFTPEDGVGHGSHVSGIIGAHGWEIPPGVAGRSQLLPVRVLAAAHSVGSIGLVGVGANPDIAQGIKVAVDLGANVINMSFGTPEEDTDPGAPLPHQAVIRYAAAQGAFLVAAAGNDGARTRFYPAAHPEVLAVGSVDAADRRSAFSTYGDHVHMYAPGERIVSIGRSGYRLSSGTSHAAPFVSGAAALVLARTRRLGRDLSSGDLRSVLMESAVPMTGDAGSRRLDLAAALDLVESGAGYPSAQPLSSAGVVR